MMLDGFGGAMEMLFGSEKLRLFQDADEAFQANEKARCLDAVERLYQLFDDDLEC